MKKTVHLEGGPRDGERIMVEAGSESVRIGRLELEAGESTAIYFKTQGLTADFKEIWTHLCFRV